MHGIAKSKTSRTASGHAHKAQPKSALVETGCTWPASAPTSRTARLESGETQGQTPAGASSPGQATSGCAILSFSLAESGKIKWVDVEAANPPEIATQALNCLLATKFKPNPKPDATSMVRVDLRTVEPDVVVGQLQLR